MQVTCGVEAGHQKASVTSLGCRARHALTPGLTLSTTGGLSHHSQPTWEPDAAGPLAPISCSMTTEAGTHGPGKGLTKPALTLSGH